MLKLKNYVLTGLGRAFPALLFAGTCEEVGDALWNLAVVPAYPPLLANDSWTASSMRGNAALGHCCPDSGSGVGHVV